MGIDNDASIDSLVLNPDLDKRIDISTHIFSFFFEKEIIKVE